MTPRKISIEGQHSMKSNKKKTFASRLIILFFLLIKLLGIEKDLQAGDFRLMRSMDAKTIATELTHGILDIWVTTLEGWRGEEGVSKLAKELDIPEQEFTK